MKDIELKNCPNCNNRIGIHDVECPYCKYIDDPKYKKHNKKVIENSIKSKSKKKTDIYKVMLLIPIVTYLVYLIFKVDRLVIILPLILLNIMCLFTKKDLVLGVTIIEIIVFIFNLVDNIKNIKIEIIIFIFGIIFVIMPKVMYITNTKKKKRKSKKM